MKPSNTPSCRRCGTKLKKFRYFGYPDIDPKREKQWGYWGNGIYCSLRCGYQDALELVKRHYR